MELEELHACVAGVKDERAIKAGKLSKLVVEISNSLVDLLMLPVRDIPQLSKSAQVVLAAADLILSACKRSMPSTPVPMTKLWPTVIPVTPSHPTCHFFFWNSCNTHTYIYIYIYRKTCAFTPLCSRVPNRNESGSRV
jgi:hypothetical protein